MLLVNALPLLAGYLLKCYKFHKQGFGRGVGRRDAEASPFCGRASWASGLSACGTCPHYLLMEVWMIWNMVPYLWYRLVIVPLKLK